MKKLALTLVLLLSVTVAALSQVFTPNTAPPGAWVPVTFSAGNFIGAGSQTWTLQTGDQVEYAYLLNGDTMTVTVYLQTTTVGGTPDPGLQIAIPLGRIAKRHHWVPAHISDNNTNATGFLAVYPDATHIQVYRATFANWSAATNTSWVRGQITFEVK